MRATGQKHDGAKTVQRHGRLNNRKRRRNIRQSLFILFMTTLMLITGGFGALPENPVTELFRRQIAEVIPAPYLDGFNSLLISLSEPPIEPSTEMMATVATSPLPEVAENPTSPEAASPTRSAITQVQVPTSIPSPLNQTVPPPTMTQIPPSESPSIILLSPNNATILPPDGKITFSWTPVKGAIKYKLEITLPFNQTVIFETTEPSRVQHIEALAIGGQFEWKVTAFDANGKVIGYSEPFNFEKPRYIPPGQIPYKDRTPQPIST